MKQLILFVLISFSGLSQQYGDFLLVNKRATLPIHYFPLYNDTQVVELDYFVQSLNEGSWEDAIHPRGGSSYHDAIMINRSNAYIIRNSKGEVLKTYGDVDIDSIKLEPVTKAKTMTHLERLMQVKESFYQEGKRWKDINGFAYYFQESSAVAERMEINQLKTGMIDTHGREVFPCSFQQISFQDGEYLVYHEECQESVFQGKKGCYQIYDSNFRLTLNKPMGNLERLKKNRYKFKDCGEVFVIDCNGNVIIDRHYQDIFALPGRRGFWYSKKNGASAKFGFLSENLEEVTAPIYNYINPIEFGFKVYDSLNYHIALFDNNGRQMTEFSHELPEFKYNYDGTITIVKLEDGVKTWGGVKKWGMIDSTGKVLIPCEYDRVAKFINGRCLVVKNKKCGIVDRAGVVQGEIKYDYIGDLDKEFIVVKMNLRNGVIDRFGKEILEPNYFFVRVEDSMIYFSDEFKKYYVKNVRKNLVFPYPSDKMDYFKNGLARFEDSGKFGLINDEGIIIAKAKYEQIDVLLDGKARAKLNGKYSLIDRTGKMVFNHD